MRLLIPTGIFLSFLFISCKQVDRSPELKAAVYSLKQANAYLVTTNRDRKDQFYSAAENPIQEKRLGPMVPAVKQVGARTGELCRWMKDLAEGYWGNETATIPDEELGELYARLVTYVKDVTDSVGAGYFWPSPWMGDVKSKALYTLQITTDSNSNVLVGERQWIKKSFDNLSIDFQRAVLHKLENDVLHTEHGVLSYFSRQIDEPFLPGYSFEPLVVLDRVHVRQGERLKLTTAIVACEPAWPCTILVNGDTVDRVASGLRTYQMAAGNPGHQKALVGFSYYRPDGSRVTFNKEIRFTVVK